MDSDKTGLLFGAYHKLVNGLKNANVIRPIKPFFSFFSFLFSSLGPHLLHMEVPRLGVGSESELQLPAHDTAIATPDFSPICDLHHSSWQS